MSQLFIWLSNTSLGIFESNDQNIPIFHKNIFPLFWFGDDEWYLAVWPLCVRMGSTTYTDHGTHPHYSHRRHGEYDHRCSILVFPRSKKGYRFYNPRFMWLLYWILTFATLGRFGVEIAAGYVPHQALLKTGFFASILQVSVLAGIFFQLWDRVVTKGSHIREALGETF